jgi:hypothetical protein
VVGCGLISRAQKDWLLAREAAIHDWSVRALLPVNRSIARWLRRRVKPGSVLHISGMVHVAFHTVRLLRAHGVDADYLAVHTSPWWNESDYLYQPTRAPLFSVLKEMWWVWSVVSRYEIVHAHFMVGVTRTGWEWPLLRAMGRHIVVHYRGCEIRDRALNQQLHPDINICQECDYLPRICDVNAARRAVAKAHGSAFLVTTPDLQDFVPAAIHVPFFVTREAATSRTADRAAGKPLKIVHATNHPGIEGTRQIREVIDSLRAKGHAIDFVELRGVTQESVLAELADADLTIGKMKMGYYANFQVESLAAGVPAITYIREDLVTPAMRDSGLILSSLSTLEETLERLLEHPEEIEMRRTRARASVGRLHDNRAIVAQLKLIYNALQQSGDS